MEYRRRIHRRRDYLMVLASTQSDIITPILNRSRACVVGTNRRLTGWLRRFLRLGYRRKFFTKCSLDRKENARIEIVVVLSVQLGNTLASQM
jgi:hypothetical protein